jgi:iron complex outermembrane receptor protein
MLALLLLVAQLTTGTITGTVRDSLGGAIPGATVRAVPEDAGEAVDALTDADGRFALAVPRGRYRVEALLDGFEPALQRVTVAGDPVAADLTLSPSRVSEGIIVTARRIEETVQDVPIPVSVVTGNLVADAGAFNVNRLKELVPTVQFYSSNPRNSAINIRGLGAPFGLTNDGIEPGVGLYIDGTFFARPAAATLDFLDVERVEVLRGPQGTLFGKNTTAGAIHVTTRRPTFTPETEVEINYGSLNLVQAKASASGRLFRNIAGRVSFSGTTRQGPIVHAKTGTDLNGLNNLGFRGQVLYAPSARLAITMAADHTRQRPAGHAQVVAGVAPTLRPADRQWAAMARDLGYTPPSDNAFDRLTDSDTDWRSHQDLGGASLTVDRAAGPGRFTAITAWRYWNWRPSNDRDFTGLPITTVSANPSEQRQLTQEIRYAGDVSPSLGFVIGAFGFRQTIASTGNQEQGRAAARVLLAPGALAATPGLLDGYGQSSDIRSTNVSAALFGQLEWSVTRRLRLLPGLRLNYDDKHVEFDTRVYGGLQTSDSALVSLQRSILSPQAYRAGADDANVSGGVTAAYQAGPAVNLFATYATSFKSIGLNLSGVPADAAGQPVLSAATVKPEDVRHVEVGIKTRPASAVTANATVFSTDIRDYQANVVNAQVGVLRGYLANADHVRVRGAELDVTARLGRRTSAYTAIAFTDGRYVRFVDAPPPLEDTGGPPVKDISGSVLPGISRWALSAGVEYASPASLARARGDVFVAVDVSYRSAFSSSASASRYLVIDGYAVVNPRIGFRADDDWSVSLWARNVFDAEYFELLSAAPGHSGLYVGLPADPRTVGVTLRLRLTAR